MEKTLKFAVNPMTVEFDEIYDNLDDYEAGLLLND